MNNEVNNPDNSSLIRVLIISDRLPERVNELEDYFKNKEKFEVAGIAEDKEEALSIARNHNFEYLIIAGYLKDERNYTLIEELKKMHKNFLTVQWSMIDSLIISFCIRYKIPLKFERTLPLDDFADFLMQHKKSIRVWHIAGRMEIELEK